MKGQQEIISIILISGILIVVVGSVYIWGAPVIQRNKDTSILEASEDFMIRLANKIKFVANNGGRDQLEVNVPGVFKFYSQTKEIELIIETDGTIYAVTPMEIPFGANRDCSSLIGTFGVDDPLALCVKTMKIDEKKFRTIYTLRPIKLINTVNMVSGNHVRKEFFIDIVGNSAGGGEKTIISIDNKGTSISSIRTSGANIKQINTFVEIRVL